jgi:hypothetical protein
MDEASPRFRSDLVATTTEADGVPCVDVSDPRTGTKFRFYDFEYQLALQLKGQPMSEVTAWASAAYGVELSAAGIGEFAGRLGELGFLESDAAAGAGATAAAPSDGLDSAEAEWMQGAKTQQFVPDEAMLAPSPDRTPVVPDLPPLPGAERTPPPRVPIAAGAPSGAPAAGGPSAVTPFVGVAPSAAAGPPAASPAPPTTAPAVSVPVTRPRDAPTVRLPPEERNVPVTRPTEAPTIPSLPSAMGSLGLAPKPAPGATAAGNAPPAPGVTPPLPGPSGAGPKWALDLEGTLGGPAAATGGAPSPAPAPDVTGGAPTAASDAPVGIGERRQPPGPEAVIMSGFTDVAKNASAPGKRGPSKVLLVVLVIVAIVAATVGYILYTRQRTPPAPPPVGVRVLLPRPTTVYRWFAGRGVVVEDEPRALGFDAGGRLAELLPAGAEFGPGETVGRLQQAAAVETLLAHHRSRLAFYGQMRDSMRAAGNRPETRQAELRLAEKQRLVDEATASLARVTLRAAEPGEVVETLAKVGALVKPGAPIARVKGKLLHGAFELEAEERAAAASLGFCRVEVIGLGPRASNAEAHRPADTASDSGPVEAQAGPRFIDCTRPGAAGAKLEVGLPGDVGLVPGQPLRLARRRYDAVFPIPRASVSGEGARRSILIATREGTAARREVTVADVGDEALVSDGIAVGDQVIVDAPAWLADGARITLLASSDR